MSKLILDSIFFRYSDLEVLKGCYLEVEKGKIACLVGRNGSGKSSLFQIATGNLYTDGGITKINNEVFHKKSKRARFKYLGYLSQKPFVPKSIKVKDVVTEKALEDDEILKNVIEQRVRNLSTGQRRYLEFQFILSLERDFLLLDEPFTGLSPILIETMIEQIISAKHRGIGILISDHYMRYLTKLGDLFYLLENGQIKSLPSLTSSS